MIVIKRAIIFSFFFFNDTATTEIYTLSLHDALPILTEQLLYEIGDPRNYITPDCIADFTTIHLEQEGPDRVRFSGIDRKSTRLNSSHGYISYAVFCLKKKKKRYCLPASRAPISTLRT